MRVTPGGSGGEPPIHGDERDHFDSGGPPERTGDALGPYRVLERLSEGSMGIVFLARDERNGDSVALKILRPELSRDEAYRKRLLREARIAHEVDHDHLVRVLDAGEHEGRCFIVSRFFGGGSLAQRLQGAPLPIPDVLRVAHEVGGALDALHDGGLIHRDVKPANIMLDDSGAFALGDFGLARGEAWTVLTAPGQVMGTPDYIAPEILTGGSAGPAADLYAFGCVVYECLAGKAPFAGRRVQECLHAHIGEEPPDPCSGRQDAPAELGWAVLTALTKDPSRRPPGATAYARLLDLAVPGVS